VSIICPTPHPEVSTGGARARFAAREGNQRCPSGWVEEAEELVKGGGKKEKLAPMTEEENCLLGFLISPPSRPQSGGMVDKKTR